MAEKDGRDIKEARNAQSTMETAISPDVNDIEEGASCALSEPGAAPGCGKGPLARYVWLVRMLISAVRHIRTKLVPSER